VLGGFRYAGVLMPSVLLNGQPVTGTTATTWGALLELVDARVAPTGEIVATVRFDGVDEPGFREEAVIVRQLASDTIVEIETESPQSLLARTLDEGAASLPEIEQAARELAAGFRGANVEGPARGLGQLAESLMNLLALVGATASAASVALDDLRVDGESVSPTLLALDTALAPLLDILEYDVAPAIPRLQGVLFALRTAANV